ncbi:small, acid-soluble spore protein, H family [Romboutsia sp. 1001216sp1]|uniref:small, acid-soluble spore protein, H family n=1 Tax=Romboutsia TaxID=1501226 RepID=UPI000B873FD0|nr:MULTISPECIES: small, acid-soluble spore protein, H family [Romboutsia]MDB8790316.1 small, acid-soluble spore protein, H family [Romboutsia sp. 1001216sp1]MDB8792251.1 small, acid-soluble spore protein, H family [Romboutsia sp. 1001216sp1]MDB8795545.1 small, acid-soluble spore protein, H family [Romboutsia sp. 1001216sp1]MDB8798576.1 small, acid-soluble spore protein, H family [Romboutsia sp. 1001216sp1]MDB8800710.1 small, acid-soluble spore protein, H family [Romboutsia sp. 1001216sp1]
MQLRRAAEIMNSKQKENIVVYYQNEPVNIVSLNSNIGTAYVKSINNKRGFDILIEELSEKKQQ